MIYDHVSIGGGVIGLNTTINLLNKFLNCKSKKKINLCIIDKDTENIPGGIAYGKKTSTHGYFNNPLRLSDEKLQKYYLNSKNFKKIENFINSYGSKYDREKFKKDLKVLNSKNIRQKKEIYLPRVAFSYFHEESFCKLLRKLYNSNKKINLEFYQGDVISFSNYKKNFFKILSKKRLEKFTIDENNLLNNQLLFIRKNLSSKFIIAKNLTLGLGVTPPKRLSSNKRSNKNYIWDFYAEGGTSYLIKTIKNQLQLKRNSSLCFVGSKAGFLESLQEIYNLKKNYKNIQINCFSTKFETLQPANISFQKKIKLKFLKKSRKDIVSAKELYNAIENELSISKNKKNYKYLIWTKILSSNILNYFLKKFSKKELNLYQVHYFQKIRSLTRFTFPETIKIKDKMLRSKMIKIINDKAQKIILNKNFIDVLGQKKKYNFDIVVNVTGPVNINEASKSIPIYKSILNYSEKKDQVIVNRDFSVKNKNNLFVPGTLAQGFNDRRKTIIKAIIENSNKSSKAISKRILNNF